ncbi:hypothetical protein FRC02_000306 [Tulasnella sp. 418]|nr:hypothetical protein FRC02_000306 [Tulasnella sp. 418]
MNSLALELIDEILEYAQYLKTGQLDRTSLRNYSLVCKRWTWGAQKLLFTNIVLFRPYELIALRETLGRPSFPEKTMFLRKSVRVLLVKVDQRPSELELRPITLENAAKTIALCPRLQTLELEFFTSVLPKPSIFDVLRSFPPLQKLSIYNNSLQGHVLHQVLACFSNLRFLNIDRHEIRDFQITQDTPPFSLYELNWSARGAPPARFVRWLLSNSYSSLEILTFRDALPDPYTMEIIMENHGPTLRSVRLATLDNERARLLRYCQNLEELQLRDYPSLSLKRVLTELTTLEHLAFSGCDQMQTRGPVDTMVELVRLLPKLRVVTWDCALPETHPDFHSLLQICQKKQVQLRYFPKIPLGRFPGEQEEMKETKRFPRYIHLSNKRPEPLYPWTI